MELVCSYVHAIDAWNNVLSGNLSVRMILIAIQAMCLVKSEVGVLATDDQNEAPRQPYTTSDFICKGPA